MTAEARLVPFVLLVSTVSLAGCVSHESDHPSRLAVKHLWDTPDNALDWNQTTPEDGLEVLPPLFENASARVSRTDSIELEEAEAVATIDRLQAAWNREYGANQTAPFPVPVLYEGEYFSVFIQSPIE